MLYFIAGLLIGIVSLIPGISGGTILVIFHIYDEITFKINNLVKNKLINWQILKELIILVFGILIGILLFAQLIELLFKTIPQQTMLFFIGIVLFNLKSIIKPNYKFDLKYFFLGTFLILLLNFFSSNKQLVISTFPNVNFAFLLYFMLMGTIDGAATIIPGISGSMLMMILGPYYLLKSYLANISLEVIIPLIIYYSGDFLGIFIGSKLYSLLNTLNENKTTNWLIGLMLMSVLILIPTNLETSFLKIISYLISIILSYICTQFINLIAQ